MKPAVNRQPSTASLRAQIVIVALAATLGLLLISGCAGAPVTSHQSPVTGEQRTAFAQFVMDELPGVQWTAWSDGTYTSTAGHDGNVDPRIPLCEYRTLTSRPERLKQGKPYAAECRVR